MKEKRVGHECFLGIKDMPNLYEAIKNRELRIDQDSLFSMNLSSMLKLFIMHFENRVKDRAEKKPMVGLITFDTYSKWAEKYSKTFFKDYKSLFAPRYFRVVADKIREKSLKSCEGYIKNMESCLGEIQKENKSIIRNQSSEEGAQAIDVFFTNYENLVKNIDKKDRKELIVYAKKEKKALRENFCSVVEEAFVVTVKNLNLENNKKGGRGELNLN